MLQEALIPVDTEIASIEWGDGDARIYSLVPISNDGKNEDIFIGVVPNAS